MMHRKLGDLLIERGLATPEQLARALEHQRSDSRALGEVLVELGIVTEAEIQDVLAQQRDVESWDLDSDPPTPEALTAIPTELCARAHALPVAIRGVELFVAFRNPGDLYAVDMVQSATRLRVRPVQAADSQFQRAMVSFLGVAEAGAESTVESFVTRVLDEFAEEESPGDNVVLTEEETRPVIGLVNQIIADAIRMRASDIHLEPRFDGLELRYRLDGRLKKVRELPRALMPMVVARVKIMADLDVADHRLPQDGRVQIRLGGRKVDLRVSVFPNHYGARIVLRVLDRTAIVKGLDEVGFASPNLRLFRDLVEKPYGIVLVTGPTGSGKTTTLYAALNELRDETTNIMTCEDPIEYDLDGINQSQVNDRIGLTFAAQLRAILRQDPDVVLIGEIRDRETAETAIRAALTGHLVLSTLHCNDAPSAVPRLLDMGIEPFLLSTSLIGVVAQRLLRVLCPACRIQAAPSERDLAVLRGLGGAAPASVWHPKGCPACEGVGYSGRTAVHEILPVTEEVGRLIAARAPIEALRHTGAEFGYRPMQEDALARVEDGRTTLDEARRLIFFSTLRASTEPEPLAKAS